MTTRKITRTQFENGVQIDTERLDNAFSDTIELINNLGPDSDVSSMLEDRLVFGMSPMVWQEDTLPWTANPTATGPFLPAVPIVPTTGLPLEEKGRIKAADPYGISLAPQLSPLTGKGYVWQVSFWTDDPILITDCDIFLELDKRNVWGTEPGEITVAVPGPYQWYWYSNQPYPLKEGDFVEDIVMQVTTDSPYNQQVASEVALTLNKGGFSVDSQMFSRDGSYIGDWSTPDMLPIKPGVEFTNGYYFRGFELQGKELNIPVPAKSRVRLNIFLPDWNAASSIPGEANPWLWEDSVNDPLDPLINQRPWSLFIWSGTLTFLKRKGA